jgi:intein/homing endonuclease
VCVPPCFDRSASRGSGAKSKGEKQKMGRHTGNRNVVENLQKALEAFLADHYKAAHEDPEWIEEVKELTQEERESPDACGCDDCLAAGQLLGRI